MNNPRDCWETPPDFWKWLCERFTFDIDVCATKKNTKCLKFITPEEDALDPDTSWGQEGAWAYCNPPYSTVEPWLEKACIEKGYGVSSFVLCHAAFGTKWAREYMYWADEVWLLNPRIQFIAPKGVKQSSNARDSMAFIFYSEEPWCTRVHGAKISLVNWK